jgi:hypothetical protein
VSVPHHIETTRSDEVQAGERMLERLAEPARRAQTRVLSTFTAKEQAQFLDLLEKFVHAFNGSTRVPLVAHPANGKPADRATANSSD